LVVVVFKYLFLAKEKILLALSPVLKTIYENTPFLVIDSSFEEFVNN
jgi:hypothetical protein